jgi:putative sterol carrier protein
MAVNIQELFNKDIPLAIARNPDAAKEIGAKYQFNIGGVGEWFMDVSPTAPKCEPGNPGGADCTIIIAAEDFQKLLENPQANGMQLFFAGKLKMSGNQMFGMKLSKLFALRG